MNILQRIAENKRAEVRAIKRRDPIRVITRAESRLHFGRSLKKRILELPTAIIAEFKRRSPSKGEIAPMADVREVVKAYDLNGAAGCSVLTDTMFFGGSLTDFAVARETTRLPLLRKEFIVDEFQIYQAAAFGADAVLLIAAILTPQQVKDYVAMAHSLGMETLLELHDASELAHADCDTDLVGVNNRDLTNFSTDIAASLSLIDALPEGAVKIAESGIKTPEDIVRLRDAGFDGFLIGEALMSQSDPGAELARFIAESQPVR